MVHGEALEVLQLHQDAQNPPEPIQSFQNVSFSFSTDSQDVSGLFSL